MPNPLYGPKAAIAVSRGTRANQINTLINLSPIGTGPVSLQKDNTIVGDVVEQTKYNEYLSTNVFIVGVHVWGNHYNTVGE